MADGSTHPSADTMRPYDLMHPQVQVFERDLIAYMRNELAVVRFGRLEPTCDVLAVLARFSGMFLSRLQAHHPAQYEQVMTDWARMVHMRREAEYRHIIAEAAEEAATVRKS